jgi:hypothetical protein
MRVETACEAEGKLDALVAAASIVDVDQHSLPVHDGSFSVAE